LIDLFKPSFIFQLLVVLSVLSFFIQYFMSKLLPLLLLVCCMPLAAAMAQDQPSSRRTVGLVLSGGGARGLAHVGVLKLLEEQDIPVDYVVGTSMGAIIGGHYAAGYSAGQIEEIVTSADFQEWSSGELLKQHRYSLEQYDPNSSFFDFDLDLDSNFNVTVNANFIDDAPLNFALAKLLYEASAKAGHNFDSLPIPFRCTAADIFTQKTEVLDSGLLNDAVRASMTVPLFFRSIKINGKYLYDGGIYSNFPVTIMREEFNPDIIIAVNVSSKVFKEYPYGKDEELLGDALKYFLLDNTDPDLLHAEDQFIEPDIQDISPLAFEKVRTLIDSGYQAARAVRDSLLHKIPRGSSPKHGDITPNLDARNISGIVVEGLLSRQKRYVKKKLGYDGSPMSLRALQQGYYKLISDGYFNDVYPSIIPDSSRSLPYYLFRLKVNPRKKLKSMIGGNLATRSIGRLFVGLDFRLLSRLLYHIELNGYSGRFYDAARAKAHIHFPGSATTYIKLDAGFNRWNYENAEEVFFSGAAMGTFLNRRDRKAEVAFGTILGKQVSWENGWGLIRNEDFYFNTDTFSTSGIADKTLLDGFTLTSRLVHNGLNKKQFPTKGNYWHASLQHVNVREQYTPGSTSRIEQRQQFDRGWWMVKAGFERYLGRQPFSWGFMVEGVASGQPTLANYRSTLINAPAFYPLIDSKTLFLENFRALSYLAGGLRQITHLSDNMHIRLSGYGFAGLKRVKERLPQVGEFATGLDRVRFAGSLSWVYETPLGPISASLNYYDEPRNRWGVLVNAGFLLFNPRNLE